MTVSADAAAAFQAFGGRAPLDGKVGLVLGASRGIGEFVAYALAAAGARLVLTARDAAALDQVAARIPGGDERVRTAAAEMSDTVSLAAAVQVASEAFGRLDFAVNNAAIQRPRVDFHEIPDETFDEVLSINLRGVFLAMKHEIRAMLAAGGGAVVNISSMGGLIGIPGIAPYVASKHGVVGLTRAAAVEYASRGIRVNAICPGTTMTEMFRRGPGSDPNVVASLVANVPMGRVAEPQEIAGAVVFLCSDAASYITGAVLPVDGGWSAA